MHLIAIKTEINSKKYHVKFFSKYALWQKLYRKNRYLFFNSCNEHIIIIFLKFYALILKSKSEMKIVSTVYLDFAINFNMVIHDVIL